MRSPAPAHFAPSRQRGCSGIEGRQEGHRVFIVPVPCSFPLYIFLPFESSPGSVYSNFQQVNSAFWGPQLHSVALQHYSQDFNAWHCVLIDY